MQFQMSFGIFHCFPCFPHCPRLDGIDGKQRMLGVDAMPHVHDYSICQRTSFLFLPQLVNPRTDYAKIGNLEEARTTHISPVSCLILYYIITTPSLYRLTEIASSATYQEQGDIQNNMSGKCCQIFSSQYVREMLPNFQQPTCQGNAAKILISYERHEPIPASHAPEYLKPNMAANPCQNFQDIFSRHPKVIGIFFSPPVRHCAL